MISPVRKRLGEILLEKKLITEDQLKECLQEQRFTRDYLGAIVLSKKLVSEESLMGALAEHFGIPYVSLKTYYVDWNVCALFSSSVSIDRKALPVRQDGDTVTVAISNPLDAMAVSKIEEQARPKKIKLVFVSQSELDESISMCKKNQKESLRDLLERE